MMKKLLPTSTAGSLPKPSWLAQPETLWSPWKLQEEELVEGKQDALRLSLQEQQQAGIDIVSDGEQTRVALTQHAKRGLGPLFANSKIISSSRPDSFCNAGLL